MTVIAYDQGTPSLSSTAKLWVTVADTNDAVPEFSKAVYTIEVAESRQPGDTVFKLDAGKGDFKYGLLSKLNKFIVSFLNFLFLFLVLFFYLCLLFESVSR